MPQYCRGFQYCNMNAEIQWLRDSLLELLVVLDPVTNDTDHFAELGHNLLLLLSPYWDSQLSERWHVF